ncbi:MAG: hypothetical protein JSW56_16050 [Deltaproteobacteria bacterium]|nr:MAG: hypothetical protein JSW56_16050 [Deltaproteobacteria bacterium]
MSFARSPEFNIRVRPVLGTAFLPLLLLADMAKVFAGLVGCSSQVHVPRAGAEVKRADMKVVENCKYLDEVEGCDYERYTTDWRRADKYRELQIMNARYEALQKAGALGATHTVWTGETTEERPCAQGIAYDCSKSAK